MTIQTETVAEPATSRAEMIPKKYIIGGVIGALLLGVLLIGGVFLLSRYFAIEVDVVRDLFIIALTLEACIFGVALIVLLVMVIRLVNTVEHEVKPILEKTSNLVGTAKGTTQFVSENIVQPTIKARSYVKGAQAGAKALLGDPKKNLPK